MLKWVGGVAAGVVLLPLLVIGVLIALIDPTSYKTRIQAAALQSLGRELVIRGNVKVSASLSPTLVAEDVTLANVAGGSRADMVRVDQMEVQLSPAALLVGRFQIVRLVLLHPDILLETNAAGEGNWHFERQGAEPASAAGAVPKPPPPPATRQTSLAQNAAAPVVARAGAASGGGSLSLQSLHVRDGRLTWRDGTTGKSTVVEVKRVSATATTPDSPVAVGAELAIGRQRVLISAQTGPMSRLQDTAAQSPWGLFVNVDVTGAKLTVAGSMTRPLEGRGYSVRVDGAIRDLAPLSWLSPVALPPLHNLTFTAKLLDQGNALPDISSLVVQAGLTNLDKISPGFTLETARIEMPRLSEPVVATLEGTYASMPLKLNATIGAPALLLPGNRANQTFAIDVTVEAGGANLAIRGAILDPAGLTRMDIALGLRVPDLSILSPLAGQRLPPLKTVAFTAHLVDPPAGSDPGMMLKGAILTLPQGDLSGDMTLLFGSRPRLLASLDSSRLDLDGLLATLTARGREELRAGPAVPPPVDVIAPQALPRRGSAVIPDSLFPLAPLDIGDADIRLGITELRTGGAFYRNIAGRAVLRAGRLALDPFHADLPGGRLDLTASIDSRPEASPMALSLRLPSADLKPLLAQFGLGELANGKLQAEAELHAAGRSLHALAATLDGRLGIGLEAAEVDNTVLGGLFNDALRAARMPTLPIDGGISKLRCVVLRMDAAQGVLTLGPAVMDGARALLNVAGKIDLNDEALTLQARPMLRTGPGIVTPVRVEGNLKEPKVVLDTAGTMQSALAAVTGRPSAAAAYPGERGGDSCTPALASLRGIATSLASLPAAGATAANAAPAVR